MSNISMFNFKKLPSVLGLYRENVLMSKITWFGVGGKAAVLFKPYDYNDLASFIKNNHVPFVVLGVGSNVIVKDEGIRGVVIKLGKNFTNLYCEEDKIIAGAGALLPNLALFAQRNGVKGLEFFIGIPGTVGGALAMNAGAFGSDVSKVLLSIKAIDEQGVMHNLSVNDLNYIYRGHNLKGKWIFVEAAFQGIKGNIKDIENTLTRINSIRIASQPARVKTGGSTFKNPLNHKAWELIDGIGYRGMILGGAKVCEKHCNFLINYNNATAKDLENLGNQIIEKVYKKYNIKMEWEIKFLD